MQKTNKAWMLFDDSGADDYPSFVSREDADLFA